MNTARRVKLVAPSVRLCEACETRLPSLRLLLFRSATTNLYRRTSHLRQDSRSLQSQLLRIVDTSIQLLKVPRSATIGEPGSIGSSDPPEHGSPAFSEHPKPQSNAEDDALIKHTLLRASSTFTIWSYECPLTDSSLAFEDQTQDFGNMNDTFRFLDLPPELRNRIYRFCLVKGLPIFPEKDLDRTGERQFSALSQ